MPDITTGLGRVEKDTHFKRESRYYKNFTEGWNQTSPLSEHEKTFEVILEGLSRVGRDIKDEDKVVIYPISL